MHTRPVSDRVESRCGTVVLGAAAKTATISGTGTGTDRKGGSRGKVAVDYRLIAIDSGTKVLVDADVTLSGTAARFGRTKMIEEMSTRLIGEFVECLEKKLDAATPEEAAIVVAGEVKGISQFFASMTSSIVNFFKRLFARK